MPNSILDPNPGVLGEGLERIKAKLAEIPPEKTGALIIAVEWKAGIPVMRTGVAARVGDHWTIGADAQLKLKDKPEAKIYAALTW